ncbi:MAG: YihA family ribosome biogenesis GTP-binding protein [Beijerinckiaceae bacterium]|nr:MAG: YihA family ribosome biogenesis GTP-binding protein [Beijerinckiaceae bacterium]
MDEQSAGAQELKDLRDSGKKLFVGACDFLWAATDLAQLPPIAAPEIAFAGRSNVGKSSLINALTNRKTLARTSNTPGRTQALNFFALGPSADAPRLRLVDMPGYGYAAASKDKIAAWTKVMQGYLRGRTSLLRVFVLIDGRHGLKPQDIEMLDLLDRAAVSYQIVLTKADVMKKSEVTARIDETLAALARRPAAFPEVVVTSSHKGDGLDDLRGAVAKLLKEHGG